MVVTAERPRASRTPTTNLQGWRSFVDSVTSVMDIAARADLETMSPAGREQHDEQRINYHSELVIVETSTVRPITNQRRMLMMLNPREISARRGLVISAP